MQSKPPKLSESVVAASVLGIILDILLSPLGSPGIRSEDRDGPLVVQSGFSWKTPWWPAVRFLPGFPVFAQSSNYSSVNATNVVMLCIQKRFKTGLHITDSAWCFYSGGCLSGSAFLQKTNLERWLLKTLHLGATFIKTPNKECQPFCTRCWTNQDMNTWKKRKIYTYMNIWIEIK